MAKHIANRMQLRCRIYNHERIGVIDSGDDEHAVDSVTHVPATETQVSWRDGATTFDEGSSLGRGGEGWGSGSRACDVSRGRGLPLIKPPRPE